MVNTTPSPKMLPRMSLMSSSAACAAPVELPAGAAGAGDPAVGAAAWDTEGAGTGAAEKAAGAAGAGAGAAGGAAGAGAGAAMGAVA